MGADNIARILLVALIIATSSLVCDAGSGKKKLLLFAKNPGSWSIVKGGGNGKLVYREATGEFTLTASRMAPHSSYTLVRYADVPPQVEILAVKESNAHGNLDVSGVWHNWTKKFWLVPTSDVKGIVGSVGSLTAWRPDRYLFEEKLLGIACLCPEPEEP
jgi:hypothetical protein